MHLHFVTTEEGAKPICKDMEMLKFGKITKVVLTHKMLQHCLSLVGIRNEGWFDPWSLLTAFRRKAAAMGVHYLHGEVTGVGVSEERVNSVQVCNLSLNCRWSLTNQIFAVHKLLVV